MPRTKHERLEARLTLEQSAAIDAAATASGLTKTAFVVRAAMADAERVLESEQITTVRREHAEAFLSWLDEPARVLVGMKALVGTPALPHR